jgi:hypothetical protein
VDEARDLPRDQVQALCHVEFLQDGQTPDWLSIASLTLRSPAAV